MKREVSAGLGVDALLMIWENLKDVLTEKQHKALKCMKKSANLFYYQKGKENPYDTSKEKDMHCSDST